MKYKAGAYIQHKSFNNKLLVMGEDQHKNYLIIYIYSATHPFFDRIVEHTESYIEESFILIKEPK